ncbi:hypothetical protein HDU76_011936 [Blyttiomyces sp. JEL0837]|nr:hypothetical protein HDU76_011936 [Blyttiomyces sp. JEL0837]
MPPIVKTAAKGTAAKSTKQKNSNAKPPLVPALSRASTMASMFTEEDEDEIDLMAPATELIFNVRSTLPGPRRTPQKPKTSKKKRKKGSAKDIDEMLAMGNNRSGPAESDDDHKERVINQAEKLVYPARVLKIRAVGDRFVFGIQTHTGHKTDVPRKHIFSQMDKEFKTCPNNNIRQLETHLVVNGSLLTINQNLLLIRRIKEDMFPGLLESNGAGVASVSSGSSGSKYSSRRSSVSPPGSGGRRASKIFSRGIGRGYEMKDGDHTNASGSNGASRNGNGFNDKADHDCDKMSGVETLRGSPEFQDNENKTCLVKDENRGDFLNNKNSNVNHKSQEGQNKSNHAGDNLDLVNGDNGLKPRSTTAENAPSTNELDPQKLEQLCWLVMVPEACRLIKKNRGPGSSQKEAREIDWVRNLMSTRDSLILADEANAMS